MTQKPISLQRRKLLVAAAATAPATALALPSGAETGMIAAFLDDAADGPQKLVLSGRLVGSDSRPVCGARIEAWPGERGSAAETAVTDADGRFFLTTVPPAATFGAPRRLRYRVSIDGKAPADRDVFLTREPGFEHAAVARFHSDDSGALRAAVGIAV